MTEQASTVSLYISGSTKLFDESTKAVINKVVELVNASREYPKLVPKFSVGNRTLPKDIDVFVFVIWDDLGKPIKNLDSMSTIEYEYNEAVTSRLKRSVIVLTYLRTDVPPDPIDSEQLKRTRDFFEQVNVDIKRNFSDINQFESLLIGDLFKLRDELSPRGLSQVSLDDFTTEDDYRYKSLIQRAVNEIRIVTRIGSRVVAENNFAPLEEAAKRGCIIKLIIGSTEQMAHAVLWSRMTVRTAEHYISQQNEAIEAMKWYASHSPNPSFIQLRRLKVLSPYTLFEIDPEAPDSIIDVVLYAFHSKPTERFALHIQRQISPKSWSYFHNNFDLMWDACIDYEEMLSK